MYVPSDLLEHAPRAIGDFLIHAARFGGVDFALAEFLFGSVETWIVFECD